MIVIPPPVAAVLLADYASFEAALPGIIPGEENTSLNPVDGPRSICPAMLLFVAMP